MGPDLSIYLVDVSAASGVGSIALNVKNKTFKKWPSFVCFGLWVDTSSNYIFHLSTCWMKIGSKNARLGNVWEVGSLCYLVKSPTIMNLEKNWDEDVLCC